MKLLELHLLAYGPFTNTVLDLSADGLSIVYGKNEAGKSTALRAIGGLLYGIPKNTGDAHVHAMRELRIGGKFLAEGGTVLKLVRRKGRDHTLLDEQGAAVDEAVMTRLVRGVLHEQFLTMFGLDHETLRRGGEALLLGAGEVGESLFGAALAGGEVHQVLRALRSEAEAIFSAKAHTKPLNEAIKSYQDAVKRTREQAMSGESLLEQERALEDAKRERAAEELERQRLLVDKVKFERAARAWPKAERRAAAQARRHALAAVVLLDEGAPAARLEHLRILQEAESELARLEKHTAELNARHAALQISETLVRHREVPRDLANRLGSHKKALADLPRLQGELAALEAEAATLLRTIGRAADPLTLERSRIDAQVQARVRKLAAEWQATERALPETERALAERQARLQGLERDLEQLPVATDTGVLKRALAQAERDGPLDQQLTRARSDAARLRSHIAAQQAALRLGGRDLREVQALALPESATVDRYVDLFAKLERRRDDLERQVSELAARQSVIVRELAALELSGQVPSEDDLERARAERDQHWKALRHALLDDPAPALHFTVADTLTRVEQLTRRSDELADRLRREADRVSRRAALAAERTAGEELANARIRELADQNRRAEIEQTAWNGLWTTARIEAQSPVEMKPWLTRYLALSASAGDLEETEALIAQLEGQIQTHIGRFRERLSAPLVTPADPPSWRGWLELASAAVERAERVEQQRQVMLEKREDSQHELARLRAARDEQARARAAWHSAWAAAVGPLGLPAHTAVEEATLVIDVLGQAFQRVDDAEKSRRRVEGIERDARAFARDVSELVTAHASDLADADSTEAAATLIERYNAGRAALAKRGELDRQLAEAKTRAARERARRDDALARLDELRRRAGAASLDELEQAERASADAHRLDREISDLSAQLADLGWDESTVPDLESDDADAVEARLSQVTSDLAERSERIRVVDGRIGSYSSGLLKVAEPKQSAADAADEAESALAKVRELAERFVKLRVASLVLAREIDRYRSAHQGPLLSRASALFEQLTLGSFSALRTDFDEKDQPVLRGVRHDGRELGVDAMSDGTRDQLYLALRLSTLERHATFAEPMPVVLDDILIHFDDDRARAALQVIAETAQKMQIIFFTHHARLVDLARQVLPARALHVRELEGRALQAATERRPEPIR